MKKYVVWTLAGLMFMAPAVFAAETATPPAPTGPQAKGLDNTQPSKEMAKAHNPKAKKKKTKPLNSEEKSDMDKRMDVTAPMDGSTPETPVK